MHFLYNELYYIHYNSPYIYLGYFLDKLKITYLLAYYLFLFIFPIINLIL